MYILYAESLLVMVIIYLCGMLSPCHEVRLHIAHVLILTFLSVGVCGPVGGGELSITINWKGVIDR